MRSLLVGALMLGSACSEVRVVDDDGNDDGGGAGTGSGGATNEPLNARLFSAGWLGTGTDHGILIWNDPDEQGIARPPDVTIPMPGVELVAGAGDDLFVFTPPQLLIYENAWAIDASTKPTRSLDVYGYAHPQLGHRMRVVRELDLLAIDSVVFTGLSTLSAETPPLSAPWFDPVYDTARDRLFVLAGDSVAVLDNASTRLSYGPDWELYATNAPLHGLASDGSTLHTVEFIGATEDWHRRAWPLDVQAPASSVVDEHATYGGVTDLVADAASGLVVSAPGEIASWPAGSDAKGSYESDESWRSLVLSQNGHLYAAGGFTIAGFPSAALADAVLVGGGRSLTLIESAP